MAALLGALSSLGCGSAGKLTCTDDAACGDGRKCARTVAGESHGVCVADYGLAFRTPADQALLTAGSVPVTVELTLGSATQPEPQTLELLVDGEPAGTLSLASRADRVASYVGWVTLDSGQSLTLEAVAARGTLDEARAGPVRVTGKPTPPPPPPPPEPPEVASVAVACQAGAELCVRDEMVAVAATVENGPAAVRVSTELAPGTYYTLSNGGSGTSYAGFIPLSEAQFPAFTRSVTVTAEALDATGGVVSSKAAQVTVTRLRWSYPTEVPVTSPAVMDDGKLVVGLSRTSDQLLALNPDASRAWVTTLEAESGKGGFVTSAPAVGKKAIWVGSDDGRMYALSLTGGGPIENGICPDAKTSVTVGHMFTPLVYQLPSASGVVPEEAALDASGVVNQRFGFAPSASACIVVPYYSTAGTSMTAAPIMTKEGLAAFSFATPSEDYFRLSVYATDPDAPGHLTYLGRYEYEDRVVSMGLDSTGAILAADHSGHVVKTLRDADGADWHKVWATPSRGVRSDPEAMVVSGDGQPIIGGQLEGVGGVDRLTSAGKPVPTWQSSLGPGSADVTGLALAAVDASGVVLYATTSGGDLFALDKDGHAVWSTRSGPTQLLGSGKLDFPTIAPAVSGQSLPTLYAGSADGHLYAVVVDTGLDPTSPWPKAHHDLRNTGNAMPVGP